MTRIVHALLLMLFSIGQLSAQTLANFSATAQTGKEVTNADFKGVVLFSEGFKVCPVCRQMNNNLLEVAKAYPGVKLLWLSVLPSYDNVGRLKAYKAEWEKKAQKALPNWTFARTDDLEMIDKIEKSIKMSATKGNAGAHDKRVFLLKDGVLLWSTDAYTMTPQTRNRLKVKIEAALK